MKDYMYSIDALLCKLCLAVKSSIMPGCFSMLACLLFYSCIKPPCQCEPIPFEDFEVKMTDGQGRNLVFGPNRIYSVDSIRVLQNSLSFSVHNASVRQSFTDTNAVRFDFYKPEGRSYIYYNQQTSQDTLDINWVTKSVKCCGEPSTFQSIGGVKWNGVSLQRQNGIYLLVK